MKRSRQLEPQKEKNTEPVSETSLFPVVVVGASAGGLEAFTELLRGLRDHIGMAFVFVQHLSPTHHSMLAELLAKSSRLPVIEATNRAELQPNHIYVIPPNVRMGILQNRLQLTPREAEHGLHLPIDFFMRSLAEDRKDKAVGAVLSGTGSDGTLGLAAIKGEGGITFAQEPKSAKYDGMPRSAIVSGCVDFVLTAENIAKELVRIARHPYFRPARAVETEPEKPSIHDKVYSLLRKSSGIDFRMYKPGTVRRRTLRRMAVHKIDSVESYAKYLQAHPDEIEQLNQDILIPVTNFFRDPEAFETLKSTVFPAIVKDKSNRGNIRIWAPGCSTGEETYSLAIALLEFLGARAPSFQIQLFGTDANERGIEKARTGIYLEQIAQDVSPERLRRFFTKVEQGYRVSKAVRDLCVFARQNIAEDPPFSQMNLVSCRNLLIYFSSDLQQKVFPILHYALRPSGFLMLGNSESVTAFANLFASVDKKHKIFAKKAAATRLHYDFSALQHPREGRIPYVPIQQPQGIVSRKTTTLEQEADRIVLKSHAPAGLVINSEMDILQFRGRTNAYVESPPGRASLNLLRMARGGLREELRKVVNKAVNKGSAQLMNVSFQHDGRNKTVNIHVWRLNGDLPPEAANYLVLFEEANSPLPTGSTAIRSPRSALRTASQDRKFLELQRRMTSTEEHLRSLVESKEALEEEFQSANEEVLSANEELQSSNEELETSKEELQSTNEELTTVNDELRNRNLELGQLNNDLNNLLGSTTLPIVMVDRGLRIRRATSASAKALKILPSDIGRSIIDIRSDIAIEDLDKLIGEVIETLATKEMEVQDREGHWYSLQIRPYRTADDKIDGAVVVLNDIDVTKTASEKFKSAKEFAEGIIDTVREPLLVLDSDLRVVYASPSFLASFQVLRTDTERKFLYRLGNEQWNIPKLRVLLEKITTNDSTVRDYEVTHDFPDLGIRTMLLNARRIHDVQGDEPLILLAIEDITERKQTEKLRARLAAIVESSADAMVTKNLDGIIESWNAGAERLFGYSADEAVGRSITLIIPPELQDEEVKILERLRRGLLIEHFDTIRLTKQGKRIPVSLTISPIRDSSGTVIGASKVARDITDRKSAEDALKQSHTELETQVQRRTESLRQLSSSLYHLQDDERRRIARELHDSVGQYLVSVKMNLAQAAQVDDQKAKAALAESVQLLDTCLSEVRTISHLLHPPLLDEMGLASAAKWYVEGFGERSGIQANLDVSPQIERLPEAVEIALFRVLQESLTNVHRHSGSRKVDIHVVRHREQVELTVRDYGKGIPSEKLEGFAITGGNLGVGLTGMRERVSELGGKFQVISENPGISIKVTVPLGRQDVGKKRPSESDGRDGSAA